MYRNGNDSWNKETYFVQYNVFTVCSNINFPQLFLECYSKFTSLKHNVEEILHELIPGAPNSM